ncbi:hypothetical protein AD929_03510 [Gluconobacter potus]|uniref:Lipoprotein n=1 Tax=Gluconobacter potus TaxID=2724927 RepID=A0A149QXZ3_9PROT|nr:hypothetical protein [Gluconobacter potus]KXV02182.1 hypothetical protein AD929_03510 [Gluconobacter potus]
MKISGFTLASVLLTAVPGFSGGAAMADDIHMAQTRFGLADGSANVLKVNGHLSTPEIDGNSGMFVEKITETADADYLLLTDVGGSACPALYSIVKVTGTTATPMAWFGNCEDEPKRTIVPGKNVMLAFPAYRPLRSKGTSAETYVYDISTGVLKKDGKVVPTACKGKCE